MSKRVSGSNSLNTSANARTPAKVLHEGARRAVRDHASDVLANLQRKLPAMTPQMETLAVDCVLDRSCHRYCFDVALGLGAG